LPSALLIVEVLLLIVLGVKYERSPLSPVLVGISMALPVLWMVLMILGAAKSARVVCARLPRAVRRRALVTGIPLLTPQGAAGLVALAIGTTLQFAMLVAAGICFGIAAMVLSRW
jgi:hypothetical protein